MKWRLYISLAQFLSLSVLWSEYTVIVLWYVATAVVSQQPLQHGGSFHMEVTNYETFL